MSDTARPDHVSAIVLTLNEASQIERCLRSLQWADDVVVVDSGSTDGTRDLAQALGARVYCRPMSPFIIAEQRNWSLENCALRGDWVLFMDADETVPADLAREIRRVCADRQAPWNAYEIAPRYLFWGRWLRHTQGYPAWHPRLLRREGVRFEGGVWEHFAPGARVGRIAIPYDHDASAKGLADWFEKHNRYSSWEAARAFDYQDSGETQALGTRRRRRLRALAARFWPLRPLARLFEMLVIRGAFLDGPTGVLMCLLYLQYELMITMKVYEQRRLRRGSPP